MSTDRIILVTPNDNVLASTILGVRRHGLDDKFYLNVDVSTAAGCIVETYEFEGERDEDWLDITNQWKAYMSATDEADPSNESADSE